MHNQLVNSFGEPIVQLAEINTVYKQLHELHPKAFLSTSLNASIMQCNVMQHPKGTAPITVVDCRMHAVRPER